MAAQTALEIFLPIVFLCLLSGGLLRFILTRMPSNIRPPFSVILFLFGFFMALITRYYSSSELAPGIVKLVNIDPQVILLLILPPLLFEASSKVDFHVFKRVAASSILIAFPGLVIATCLTACFFKILNYDLWDWNVAFVCASILSATDPVATTAALEVLGAPLRISTLIEGEAFLNDGSAFVMFLLFREAVAGKFKSPGEIVVEILQLSVGGPALGIACGWKPIFHDPLMESGVILTSTYFVYFLAEELGLSSVLAIVCFGIFFAYKGREFLDQESFAHHRKVISQVGYLSNTFIFIIAGAEILNLFTGVDANSGASISSKIFALDYIYWLHLLALYVALFFIRSVSILLLYPILRRIGYGFDLKTLMILVWSGLRGVVSLTLALLVVGDDRINRDVRYLIAFHVSGIVLLTTIINGTTTEWLYGKLNIDAPNKHAEELSKAVLSTIHAKKIIPTIARLRKNWFYYDADWDIVQLLTLDLSKITIKHGRIHYDKQHFSQPAYDDSSVTDEPVPTASRNFKRYEDPEESTPNLFESTPQDFGDTIEEWDEHVRNWYLEASKSNYSHQFELGYIDIQTRELLMESADVGLESGPSSFRHTTKFPSDIPSNQKIIHQWQTLRTLLKPKWSNCLVPQIKNRAVSSSLLCIVSTLSAYVHANNQVLSNLLSFLDPHSKTAQSLSSEVGLVNSNVLDYLESLQQSHPMRLIQIKTIKAAEYLVRLKRELVRSRAEKGLLQQNVRDQVVELLEKVLKRLTERPFSVIDEFEWIRGSVEVVVGEHRVDDIAVLYLKNGREYTL